MPRERLSDWTDFWGLGLSSPVLRLEDQRNTGERKTQPCRSAQSAVLSQRRVPREGLGRCWLLSPSFGLL